MRTILVIGAGSRFLAEALRMIDEDAGIREFVTRHPIIDCVRTHDFHCEGAVIAKDDPFAGGGRSKGEKKRAARERRLKGGY